MIDAKHLEKKMQSFIECLRQERFYDAHEALEVLWFPLRKNPSDEVNLLRGYINASVSFELYKKGRFVASEKVWNNFIKYQLLIDEVEWSHQAYYKDAQIQILKIRKKIEENSSAIIGNGCNVECGR